jgi:PAS domain-containing protein
MRAQKEAERAIEILVHTGGRRWTSLEEVKPGLDALSSTFGEQVAQDFILEWSLLQDIPAEVCIKSFESRMIWANRSLFKLCDKPTKTFYGAPPDFGAPPEALWGRENGAWLRKMDELAQHVNRTVCHVELMAKRRTYQVGIRVPFAGIDEDDKCIGVLGLRLKTLQEAVTAASTLQQISPHKKIWPRKTHSTAVSPHPLTKELQELAKRMNRFLSHLPSEICIKNEESRVIWCNSRFASLVGLPFRQLRGRATEDMWPAKRAAWLKEKDQEVLSGKTVIYDDTVISHASSRRQPRFGIRFPIRFGERRLIGSVGFDAFSKYAAESISKALVVRSSNAQYSRREAWFLSYTKSDYDFARKLQRDLKSNHIEAYLYVDDPHVGSKLSHHLREKIDQCDRFVGILSVPALNSKNVRLEIDYALQTKPSLFCPLRLDTDERFEAACRGIEEREKLIELIGIQFDQWRDKALYEEALRKLVNYSWGEVLTA